jgi:hypothetical protein
MSKSSLLLSFKKEDSSFLKKKQKTFAKYSPAAGRRSHFSREPENLAYLAMMWRNFQPPRSAEAAACSGKPLLSRRYFALDRTGE